jgi:hypothetical protein
MASVYPANIDSFPTNHQDDAGEVIHAQTTNDIADAVNKIEAELGTNPSGSLATVAAVTAPLIGDESAIYNATANAADTYLNTGFGIATRIGVGSFWRWNIVATKTAAGVATPIFTVRTGTAGTTADTARLTFTLAAQTAATDTAWFTIEVGVQTYSASGVLAGGLKMMHQNAATGFGTSQIQVFSATSSTFDLTAANLKLGLSVNPGASGVWTIVSSSLSAHGLVG